MSMLPPDFIDFNVAVFPLVVIWKLKSAPNAIPESFLTSNLLLVVLRTSLLKKFAAAIGDPPTLRASDLLAVPQNFVGAVVLV